MEWFLGQIQPWGFGFASRGWSSCSGQLLPIAQNTALFSLLGTTFGGDGRTTFALPDLRGRSIVHPGTGPGLDTISWGERSGNEWTYLSVLNLPSHTHSGNVVAEGAPATGSNPQGNMFGASAMYTAPSSTQNRSLSSESITLYNTGLNSPFSNRDPYLGVWICIATTGVFPSRN